jgi:hypothetical protein
MISPRQDLEKPATSASPVEEVFRRRVPTTTSAAPADLVYSVNGGEEKTIKLYGQGAKSLTEVSGAVHHLLEEWA